MRKLLERLEESQNTVFGYSTGNPKNVLPHFRAANCRADFVKKDKAGEFHKPGKVLVKVVGDPYDIDHALETLRGDRGTWKEVKRYGFSFPGVIPD